MFRNKKVVVVMPAYNAARTLRRTYDEVIAQEIVDLVIIVDDGSKDDTVAVARTLPNTVLHIHPTNQGYGANQKTCYRLAAEAGAEIVIMIHPDYQYTPRLIPAMAALIATDLYPCVLGSRILGGYALRGGMPWWKYLSNRLLTLVENMLLGRKAVGVPHRLSGILRAIAGATIIGASVPTTSFSTTRCWPKFYGSARRLRRLVAPRAMSLNPLLSTFRAARSMV